MNEKKLISKSETIGVPDIRRLMELAQELNKILTPTEYLAIVNVYNSAINRLLRENGLGEVE